MISKNQIKHVNALQQVKFRKEFMEFVVEGEKMVEELLESSFQIKQIYAIEDWLVKSKNQLHKEIKCDQVSPKELERISSLKTPNKVLAIATIPSQNTIEIDPNNLTLVLDHIQDPGNLGTIIRTADWFGIKHIICSEDTASCYNPKVIQSTMGSFTRVQVHYTDLVDFLSNQDKDLAIMGSLLDGDSIYEKKLPNSGFIVIGNESKGISEEIQNLISDKIKIPSYAINKSDQAESLNASIACSIICAEIRRQKV